MMKASKTLSFVGIFLLVGCATMPLGTAVKLSRISLDDVLSADPSFVRAAVELDQRAQLELSGSTLQITLLRGNAADTLDIPLKILATGREVHVGLPIPQSGRYWTLLALTDQGADLLRELQARARQNPASYTGLTIEVRASFADPPEDLR